jgi:WD40 repeat protein
MSVSWSPDGKLLAVGCADRMIKVWDVSSARERRVFSEGIEGTILTITFLKNGKFVAASGEDPRICICDVESGKVKYFPGHVKEVRAIAPSPDGAWLASGSADETLRIWDATSGELRASIQDPSAFFSVSFSRKGETLAGCAGNGTLRLFDVSALRASKSDSK